MQMTKSLHMKSLYQFIFSLIFVCFFFTKAQAAVITNLAEHTEQFEVQTSKGFEPVTIAAGETWRLPGIVRVRYRGREILINDVDEYALWGQDGLGPQRRLSYSKFK